MNPLSPPTPRLLLYAHGGYHLLDDEIEALVAVGWACTLPREILPSLRRARRLSWEIMRLEGRRRDLLPPSSHLMRWAEAVPTLKRHVRQERDLLDRRIEALEVERKALQSQVSPLETAERDRLLAYRPVSKSLSMRLTEEGKRVLRDYRFSEVVFLERLNECALDEVTARFTEAVDYTQAASWWRQRLRSSSQRSASGERDALWLAVVLSRGEEEVRERLSRAEALYHEFERVSLWWNDPLPLCLALLAADTSRTVAEALHAYTALTGQGWETGADTMLAAAVLVAGTPASVRAMRLGEFHRLWRELTAYGLAFSHALFPVAARLSALSRPVEQTALLFREFDNRTTRYSPLNDRATRIAASLLASLTLDSTDRSDLYGHESPYLLQLMRRYRALRSALSPRCRFEASPEASVTLLSGLLSVCPGSVNGILDNLDALRERLSRCDLPRSATELWLTAMLLERVYPATWEVNHAALAGELIGYWHRADASARSAPIQ